MCSCRSPSAPHKWSRKVQTYPPRIYIYIGCKVVAEVDHNLNQIYLKKPESKESTMLRGEAMKTFAYDGVYSTEDTQRQIYDETAFPLVESVLEGYNGISMLYLLYIYSNFMNIGTIFAYGQTGCGKTYTMVGDKDDPNLKGIIPNAFSQIFGCIDGCKENRKFLVRCSYLEIYMESIHDLLGSDLDAKLEMKEDPNKGLFVKGLTGVIVKNFSDIDRTMNRG